GTDATVRQWDVATGKELKRFGVPRNRAALADFLAPPPPPAAGVVGLDLLFGGSPGIALGADGKVLAMSGDGTSVRLWEVATGKELRKVDAEGGASLAIAMSLDSKTLATHGSDGAIRLYEVATGKTLGQFGRNPGKDNPSVQASLAFSPDGKKLA